VFVSCLAQADGKMAAQMSAEPVVVANLFKT
jgi:hypothetical protein